MAYIEGREQAFLYYNLGKNALEKGDKSSALSHFNLARSIAVQNDMIDLIRLIDDVIADM